MTLSPGPLPPHAPEPPAGSLVRDGESRLWRSQFNYGEHLWWLQGNEDADPLGWSELQRFAPLTLVRTPRGAA